MEQCWLYDDCNHKDCNNFCIRKEKLTFLYNNSLLPYKQRKRIELFIDDDKADLDAFTKLATIEKNILSFVDNGNNLYLFSSQVGNGKTSWAIRMLQSYFNRIWPRTDLTCRALFISVPRFLLAIKDNISNKNDYASFIKDNILKADLVIWDDIFHKSITEFEYTQLLSYIDSRLALGKSNIYTSNTSPNEASRIVDARIVSRVTGLATQIELKGGDKRSFSIKALED